MVHVYFLLKYKFYSRSQGCYLFRQVRIDWDNLENVSRYYLASDQYQVISIKPISEVPYSSGNLFPEEVESESVVVDDLPF